MRFPLRPVSLLSVLLLALALPARVSAQEPAPGRLVRDEWVVILMQGKKVGWEHHETRAVTTPDGERYVTRSESETVMQRENDQVTNRDESVEEETADGALLRSANKEVSSGMETRVEATVKGDKLVIASTTAGDTRTKELPWTKDVLGTYGETLFLRKQGFAPGTVSSYTSFSTDSESIETTKTTVKGREKVEVHGGTRELIALEQTSTHLPGVTARAWVDDGGNILKLHIPIAGGVEMLLVPREVAQAETTGPGPDIMAASSAPCSIRLPHPYSISAATYILRAKEGTLPEIVFPESILEMVERTPEAITVRVESLVPPAAAKIGPVPDSLREFLGSNGTLQADDPEVAARTKEAVGTETDVWKAAKALERWVHQHIKKKNYGVSFATAKEVVRSREGDCTEHGVLLAAMARAAGIPSRVIAGLVYYRNGFGGHMWTEVNVGGSWYPLDATLPCEQVDATHLALGASSLQNETPSKAMSHLIGVIGSFTVDVQRFTLDGKETTVGPDFRDHAIEGDHFSLTYYGLTLTRPAGCEFRPPPPNKPEAIVVAVNAAARIAVPVLAQGVGYAFSLEQAREELAGLGQVDDEKSWEIQGRKAWSCRLSNPQGSGRFAFVHDGDTAFVFVLPQETAEGTKAWTALIESLHFAK